ncbi:uncharacterized protein LOC128250528 [Octopus bimaculoides]|uniref:uncharacterized protein LOC128250528 n=1 Tax=Octopus bimaculoides TaxID=37653 RepID=UPI0022E02B25|nr:uncharacterized protein LOC128250528 [Octopus bimaculoides]
MLVVVKTMDCTPFGMFFVCFFYRNPLYRVQRFRICISNARIQNIKLSTPHGNQGRSSFSCVLQRQFIESSKSGVPETFLTSDPFMESLSPAINILLKANCVNLTSFEGRALAFRLRRNAKAKDTAPFVQPNCSSRGLYPSLHCR